MVRLSKPPGSEANVVGANVGGVGRSDTLRPCRFSLSSNFRKTASDLASAASFSSEPAFGSGMNTPSFQRSVLPPPIIWGPDDPRPTPPIVIPPDAVEPGVPTHPIYLPPGIWGPTDPRPSNPIAGIPGLPGYQPPGGGSPPLEIWGGGNVPMPTPPIYFPPDAGLNPPPDGSGDGLHPSHPIVIPPDKPVDPSVPHVLMQVIVPPQGGIQGGSMWFYVEVPPQEPPTAGPKA